MSQAAHLPAATVLVVDDHPAVRATVMQLLEDGVPDCRMIEADSGEEALALFDTMRPHALVLDIRLPGIDGIEVARRVRQLYPDTPVILHTANDLPIYREAAAELGAAAFVCKGRDSLQLVSIVSALLRRVGR